MSEDEKERFEITDYDIENEFSMYRKQRRPTKHQQIYGIWADDSDNETDTRPSFKSKTKPKNYSEPIGFVAGGVQQSGKKNKEIAKEIKPENGSDNSEDEKPSTSFKLRENSSDSEEEEAPSRLGFGVQRPQQTQSTVTEITGDIAGMRSAQRGNKSLQNQGVGNWEKHTKGIGAKLLLQMGFQPGKGLGKDLQGISAPVEAHLRKGRGAIGAYGPEKPASIPKPKEKQMFGNNKIEPEEEEHSTKWRKEDTSLQKKTRYYYRSVDDVIEKGKRPGAYRNAGNTSHLSKVKVIDMTGPQQRVLSGYHALSGLKAPPGVEHFEDVVHKKCSNFALPEIQHNLDILVDMCEQDIIRIDRTTRTNQDRIITLQQEELTLKNLVIKEEKMAEKLSDVVSIVTQLADQSLGLSLGQVASIFKDLQTLHSEDYQRYQLRDLAPALVGPLITSALASWQPLTQPEMHMDIFRQWQELLAPTNNDSVTGMNNTGVLSSQRATLEGNKSTGIQPYDSLVWHTWLPVIRTCVNNWNPRYPSPLIHLLTLWHPLLPPWLYSTPLLDHLILPRLSHAVTTGWDPLTDTLPVHTWLHPWAPILSHRLHTPVYGAVLDKLAVALVSWHPSDPSARAVLVPWQRALPEGMFSAFLQRCVVGKLGVVLGEVVISPHQQQLGGWNSVMDWQDMLSVGNMTLLLDKFFFPRWLQTLALWLNHNPDYTQVTEWYSGWKRMMSEQLLQQPTIKDHFHKALEMMNRAVSAGQQPGAKESVCYLTKMESTEPPPPPPPRIESIAEAVRTAAKIPQGFRDLIAKRCEERGILFVPVTNRYHEARQVYKLGASGTHCYVDRNVLFYSRNNSAWLPTSLNRLLDMA